MSAASHRTDHKPGRALRPDERRLVLALAKGTEHEAAVMAQIVTARVQAMRDGGMGSLLFLSDSPAARAFGREVGEASFTDEDGIAVSASLNLDRDGGLFELDLFKADGSPVRRMPETAALLIAGD